MIDIICTGGTVFESIQIAYDMIRKKEIIVLSQRMISGLRRSWRRLDRLTGGRHSSGTLPGRQKSTRGWRNILLIRIIRSSM